VRGRRIWKIGRNCLMGKVKFRRLGRIKKKIKKMFRVMKKIIKLMIKRKNKKLKLI
jgi:hypothetical protein